MGNLSDKEFRIMIVILETRIEKMQEMFNKDLKEIKLVNQY